MPVSQGFGTDWVGSSNDLPNDQQLILFVFWNCQAYTESERRQTQLGDGALAINVTGEKGQVPGLSQMVSYGGQRQGSCNSLCKLDCLSGCQRGGRMEIWIYRVNVWKKRIYQVRDKFTTKICFKGNLFQKYRHQILVLLVQKEMRRGKKNVFLLHRVGEKGYQMKFMSRN